MMAETRPDLVAGGHLTPDPIESIYSGIVSIRSLRLVIFLAKLNNLEVWGADIGNAYLEAKWIFLGHITFQIGILSPTTRIKTLLNGGTGLSNPGPIQS